MAEGGSHSEPPIKEPMALSSWWPLSQTLGISECLPVSKVGELVSSQACHIWTMTDIKEGEVRTPRQQA